MRLGTRAVRLGLNVLLLGLVWMLFQPHQAKWHDAPHWASPPSEVRTAVLNQLRVFQDGYGTRDTSQVGPFVARLFSRDLPVVLGTLPGEVYAGTDAVSALIQTDWESWGDCRFRLEDSHIAASGNTAWFAAVGTVRFDVSRFLVLPLRLSGVMVNEDGTWRIRQLQFQFDLDLSPLLALLMVLLAWFAANALLLGAGVIRMLLSRR